ncbi:hypothetical protein ACFSQT_12080 [Mesorhizobium calcicola]|uniref:Uncharacterized protein n=1 Tax=Mesorhizobium calcicola TaxID=1300310 RepID=A0ABW4WB56_9HYPH
MTTTMTRRAAFGAIASPPAIGGAVAASAALPATAEETEIERQKASPELRAAIKAHRDADAYWKSVCTCTDSAILGREATAEEHQKWEDANDGEYSALWDVCRFPARSTADLAAKGRHLKKYHSWHAGDLDSEQVRALLLSMSLVGKGGAV